MSAVHVSEHVLSSQGCIPMDVILIPALILSPASLRLCCSMSSGHIR